MHFLKLTCAVFSGFVFFVGGVLCLAIVQQDPSLGIIGIIPIFVGCFGLSFGFLIGYAIFDIAENVRTIAANITPKSKTEETEDTSTPDNITRLRESREKAKVRSIRSMLAAGYAVQEVAEVLGLDPSYVGNIARDAAKSS